MHVLPATRTEPQVSDSVRSDGGNRVTLCDSSEPVPVLRKAERYVAAFIILAAYTVTASAQDSSIKHLDWPALIVSFGTLITAFATWWQIRRASGRMDVQNKRDNASADLDSAEIAKIQAEIALQRKAASADAAQEVFAGYRALIDALRQELTFVKDELREIKKTHQDELSSLSERHDQDMERLRRQIETYQVDHAE